MEPHTEVVGLDETGVLGLGGGEVDQSQLVQDLLDDRAGEVRGSAGAEREADQRLDVVVATRGHQRADPPQVPSGGPGALGVDEQAPLDLRAHQWPQTQQIDLPGPPRCRAWWRTTDETPPRRRSRSGPAGRTVRSGATTTTAASRGRAVCHGSSGCHATGTSQAASRPGWYRPPPDRTRSREGAAARSATRPGRRPRRSVFSWWCHRLRCRWHNRSSVCATGRCGHTRQASSSARTWRFKPVAAVRNAALPTPRCPFARPLLADAPGTDPSRPSRDRSQPSTTHSQR